MNSPASQSTPLRMAVCLSVHRLEHLDRLAACFLARREGGGRACHVFAAANRPATFTKTEADTTTIVECGYDNIGNRITAQEAEKATAYDANQLNQYTNIEQGAQTPFIPQHDAQGNQTLLKTATGIWQVEYNADNRPVSFTKTEADNTTVITCGYDYMGRRCIKKITVNGVITLHQRYIYRGYLQIACVDLTRSGQPGLWLITWDPAQPTATRPLAIQKNGTWYTCGHDLTKNVTELYNTNGTIATACDYTPFGQVTATGTADQPIQWSSEYNDTELGLVYYNYRHYNPQDGRWINRDILFTDNNQYFFVINNPNCYVDILGNAKQAFPRNSIPPANRPIDGFRPTKPSIPMNIPPNNTASNISNGLREILSIVNFIDGDGSDVPKMECLKICNNYSDAHKLKQGCSCCFCVYNIHETNWGNLTRLNYSLHSARITPKVECHVPGWKALVILVEKQGDPKRIYDPVTKLPVGRLGDTFNV